MSANIDKSKLPLKEVLKPTGFFPPENVAELTLSQAIASDNPTMETNKAVTIDVSKYTESVVIEPTEGKDGMKKVTVTLTGITPADPQE